jgi:hypothetical protein
MWKRVGAISVAVIGGAYGVLLKLAETKPEDVQSNLGKWLGYGRSLAITILPGWLRTRLAAELVGAAVLVCLASWVLWWWLNRYPPFQLWRLQHSDAKQTRYLSGVEVGLQHAMYAMSLRSAWARWYMAQHLAAVGTSPLPEAMLLDIAANSMVLDALVNGTLTAMGRLPGQIEAVSIPRHFWHYTCFEIKPDDRTIWRISLRDRNEVPEERKRYLPKYEDLLINTEEFERLFPRNDPLTDAARRKLLRQARRKGASKSDLEKLA